MFSCEVEDKFHCCADVRNKQKENYLFLVQHNSDMNPAKRVEDSEEKTQDFQDHGAAWFPVTGE